MKKSIVLLLLIIALCTFGITNSQSSVNVRSQHQFVRVYEDVVGSMVRIEHNGRHCGSGFIVYPDRLIVTAKHVVRSEGSYAVVLNDGRRFHVQEVNASETSDCAILKIDASNLPALKLAFRVSIGEPILVIGTPFEVYFTNYATKGIVSKGLHRNHRYGETFLFDAAISPGNSGGPVLNSEGRVIGLAVAITNGVGVNVAVESSVISELLKDWNRQHDREKAN